MIGHTEMLIIVVAILLLFRGEDVSKLVQQARTAKKYWTDTKSQVDGALIKPLRDAFLDVKKDIDH